MSENPYEAPAPLAPAISAPGEETVKLAAIPGPGPGAAILWFIAFIVIEVTIAAMAVLPYIVSGHEPDLRLLTHGNVVLNFVLAAVFVLAVHGRAARRTMAIGGFNLLHAALAVAVVSPLLLVDTALANWASELIYPPTAEEPIAGAIALVAGQSARERFAEIHDQAYALMAEEAWPLIIFFSCLLPAIGEELLFRGFLGRGLVARMGPIGGILLTSFLFALLHLEPAHMLGVLPLGITLHIIYLASKSLTLTMVVHFLNNLAAFGGYKIAWDHDLDVLAFLHFDATGVPLDLFLLSVALWTGLLILFVNARAWWQLPDGTEWQPGYVTAEIPPSALQAQRQQRWPSPGLAIGTGVLLLLFLARYGMIIAAQMQGAEG